MREQRRRRIAYLLLVPGVLFLTVFFLIPMFTMLSASFMEGSPEQGFDFTGHWQNYVESFSDYDTQIYRSLFYGLIVTLLTLVVSFPVAYWIAFRGGRRKNLYLLLLLLPFFTPFIIRTLAWKQILADNGIFLGTLKDWGLMPDDFQLLATPIAVIGGLTYNFLPFMALPLYVALERVDPRLLDAASDLYSDRRETFFKVTLPLAMPGIFAGSLLTFIPAVGDFINSELLGSVRTTMIGQVIQRHFLTTQEFPAGAALSFLLMAGILVGVFVYARALGTEELTG
jgi:spermidine/putrescine transport system permease protein